MKENRTTRYAYRLINRRISLILRSLVPLFFLLAPCHGDQLTKKFGPSPDSQLRAVVNGRTVTVDKIEATNSGAAGIVITTTSANETIGKLKIDENGDSSIVKNAEQYKGIAVPIIERGVITAQTASTTKWEDRLQKNIGTFESAVKGVSAAVKNLNEAVTEFLKDPDNQKLAELRDQGYELTREQLIEAYNKTTDPDLRTHLAGQYGLTVSEKKAWYGRDDNYSPEVYEKIFESAASCVAIADSGAGKPFASGVLIGDNLILTCAHQVEDRVKTSLRVWFDYRKGISEPEKCRVVSRFLYHESLDPTLSPLDFCLLEIDRGANPSKRNKIVLSDSNPTRGTAIYLIGHPSRFPQIVHDNSWILFPYEASEPQMNELRIAINAEFIGQATMASIATDHFLQSYRESQGADGEKIYHYEGSWGGRRLPLIGAECDTFKGDSGSPAILRETGELIGILIEGQPDQGDYGSNSNRDTQGYHGGWAYHERIIPISSIVKVMDNQLPSWRKTYNPVFSNN